LAAGAASSDSCQHNAASSALLLHVHCQLAAADARVHAGRPCVLPEAVFLYEVNANKQ
jgi:hypothetical protein